MQVMAHHTSRDIIDSVHRLGVARADAVIQLEALENGTADFSSIDALAASRRKPGCMAASRPSPLKPSAETAPRSEEHTSELQSLMRISYAVFCLKKKK